MTKAGFWQHVSIVESFKWINVICHGPRMNIKIKKKKRCLIRHFYLMMYFVYFL